MTRPSILKSRARTTLREFIKEVKTMTAVSKDRRPWLSPNILEVSDASFDPVEGQKTLK